MITPTTALGAPALATACSMVGASDLAIVEFRKQMLEAVQRFQQDGVAIGTGEQAIPADVCSFQAIVPKETDWRDFAASPVWLEQVADPEAEKQYQV